MSLLNYAVVVGSRVERLASAALVVIVACSVEGCIGEGPETGVVLGAVVGGSPNEDDPGVVLLLNPVPGGCTGTVISDRVVLTAKHCVTNTQASLWRVLVGYDPLTEDGLEAEYTVAEVREAPGDLTAANDIALLLMAHDFEFPKYRWAFRAPSNLDTGLAVRYVGYGNTVADDNGSAGTRNERSGNITYLDDQTINAPVGVCYGDSGGPLFTRSGIVLGVAHDITTEDCLGDGRFTRVDQWRDFINEAITDMGGCVPTAFNDVCDDQIDNECNGVIDDCPPPPADADADADSDGDGDGDGDADGDSDAGVASDGGVEEMGGGCTCDDASIASSAGATLSTSLAQLVGAL